MNEQVIIFGEPTDLLCEQKGIYAVQAEFFTLYNNFKLVYPHPQELLIPFRIPPDKRCGRRLGF